MFTHRLDQIPKATVLWQWFLLCFNAGCINAGGFLATGRFVSHVTGFATLFGVDLAKHNESDAFGILSVPLFFLIGSFLAGLLVDRQIYLNRKPRFDLVMALSASCLFLAASNEGLSQFQNFGSVIHFKQIYILMALLCLACGLQNGAITSSSGSSIRTTHLTGLTTDLGLGIARSLTFRKGEVIHTRESRANLLRSGSILSFIVGSGVGSWMFLKLGYQGFALSGLITLYAAWHGRRFKIIQHSNQAA